MKKLVKMWSLLTGNKNEEWNLVWNSFFKENEREKTQTLKKQNKQNTN